MSPTLKSRKSKASLIFVVPASGPKIPDEILRLAIVKSPSASANKAAPAKAAAAVPEGVPRMRDGRPKYEGTIMKSFIVKTEAAKLRFYTR